MFSRREVVAGIAVTSVPWAKLVAQGRVVTLPIELTRDRVTIACMIGGQGPFRFVIDTGGIVSLIELDLAKRLKLRDLGQRRLGMLGGQAMHTIYEARDVVLGGIARQASRPCWNGYDPVWRGSFRLLCSWFAHRR